VQFVTEGWSVCRTTVEQLQNEINALDTRIKKVRKQIDLSSTEKEIKMQMGEFLQVRWTQQALSCCSPDEYRHRWLIIRASIIYSSTSVSWTQTSTVSLTWLSYEIAYSFSTVLSVQSVCFPFQVFLLHVTICRNTAPSIMSCLYCVMYSLVSISTSNTLS
jgi:hypothetical protein